MNLDGKMWPDGSDTDASSHYKVCLIFSVWYKGEYALLLYINLNVCKMCYKKTIYSLPCGLQIFHIA